MTVDKVFLEKHMQALSEKEYTQVENDFNESAQCDFSPTCCCWVCVNKKE